MLLIWIILLFLLFLAIGTLISLFGWMIAENRYTERTEKCDALLLENGELRNRLIKEQFARFQAENGGHHSA